MLETVTSERFDMQEAGQMESVFSVCSKSLLGHTWTPAVDVYPQECRALSHADT